MDSTVFSLKTIVQKIGENSPTFVSGQVLGSRASLYTVSGEPNVLGITISNIQRTDPDKYRCIAFFQGGTSINTQESKLKTLVVLGKIMNKKILRL